MEVTPDQETEAINRLIAEIDSIETWRQRVGRRVVVLFLVTFAAALSLLFYIAAFDHQPQAAQRPAGPQVQGVLQDRH